MVEIVAAGDRLADADWQVYIIRCTDNSLYTGITLDIDRRIAQHGSARGAKYFRGKRPVEVVFLEGGHTRSSASRREATIKKLRRAAKLRLIETSGGMPD
ncbi:MAG: GIY-YIG nuclease family protein [Halobacteria archaeon]|nr:GIY-YIG nuclease family protein [Halobacteria archaeon]